MVSETGLWKVDAFNPSPEWLNIARDRAIKAGVEVSFSQSDIASFRPTVQYDLVVCAMILHFFDDTQVKDAIKKMKSWTKNSDTIYISVMSDQNPETRRPKLFKAHELESYFLGCKIVKSYQLKTDPILMPDKIKPEQFYFDYLIAKKT